MSRVLLIPTLLLLLLIPVCYLAAHSAAPESAGSGKDRPIVFGLADDIKTLDVSKMSWANDIRVAMGLWEGLTKYDPRTLAPVPGVAKSWNVSADGKTYTFHLRPEARWSNGDPVTADDFLFSWRRVLNPATGADYISLFSVIEGAQDFTDAIEKHTDAQKQIDEASPEKRATLPAPPPLPDPAILRVAKAGTAEDPQLVVHLKAPCTYFLDILAMPAMFPLHAGAMQKYLLNRDDPTQGYDALWTRPPDLVSNGPFTLAEWRMKQYLRLERSEKYWDKANVQCRQMIFKTIKDSRQMLIAYQTGALDILTALPESSGEDIIALKRQDPNAWPDVYQQGVFGSYYYIFNCTRKPFNDKRVRKAIAMAIDRDVIARLAATGQVPMGLIIPPNAITAPLPNGKQAKYPSPPELPYDVKAAQKLLAEAGYPDGHGIPSIDLVYNTEAAHAKLAQMIGQMLHENLGLSITYRGLERGSFGAERRESHNFDIARGGWYGDYNDPTTWLDLLRSTDGNNDGKFSSPAYDDLMNQAAGEADPQKRFELLSQAENMLVNDEVPLIPLYQYADGFMFDGNKIDGIYMNARMMTEVKWIHRK